MAKGYRRVDRDQPFLFPPDMREWLPAGHAVWLVIEAVRRLDTAAFHARRRTGGAGAAGYDPDMMLTLLVWAYANGITSSRRIERLCQQDVAFRVTCAGHLPDHVTIARFRQQFADTAAALFAQVLLLCAQLGMGQVGVVALDGTKVTANASKDANRTEAGLAKLAQDLAAAHAAADAAEDALFGEGKRGDDDPGDPFTRAERVAAALASLQAGREAREAGERAKAEEQLRAARAGAPAGGRPAAGAEVELARANLARQEAAARARREEWERAAAAGLRPGRAPARPQDSGKVRAAAARLERARAAQAGREAARQAAAATGAEPKRNLTDPASRLMPVRGGGFTQGYNAQNVTSEDGLVIATSLTQDTTGTPWYQPMTSQAAAAAAAMAEAGGPGDGHHRPGPGRRRLPVRGQPRQPRPGPADRHRQAPRPGRSRPRRRRRRHGRAAGPRDRRDDRPPGHRGRHRRLPQAQPHRRDLPRRPQAQPAASAACRSAACPGHPGEWTFATAVRNLRKAITSGHLTQQALAALPG